MNERRYKHKLLALVVMLAVSGTAVARGADETADQAAHDIRTLSVLYPKAVASVPMLIVLEAYPDDYDGEFFTDHPQSLAQLVQGQIDLLTTGYPVGLNRYNAAGDIRHLATPIWSVSALMTAEPVDSLADLAGGTVYSPFEGSPIDIYLEAVLEEAGLTGNVEIAYAPFPQSAGLLMQKKTDAAVLVEPLASKLEVAGAAYRYENLSEGWERVTGGEPRSPQVSVFATADVVESDAASLLLFLERYTAAVDETVADPAAAAVRYADDLGFSVAVVEKALRNTLFEMPGSTEERAVIDTYASVMGTPVPDDAFYAGL